MVRTLGQRNEWHSFAGEGRPERFVHHTAFPRSPIEAQDPAIGKTPGLLLGDFVEHLVCDRVVHLTHATIPCGRRAEQHEGAQGVTVHCLEQVSKTGHFWLIDLLETFGRLVEDVLVGEYASPVH